MAIRASAEELQSFMSSEFPQATITVEKVDEQEAWVRQPVDDSHLRPGATVSGPTMMAVADTAAYVTVLSHIGIVPLAVTSNLNINFLRKPDSGKALLARSTLLHLGRRSVLAEVRIYSEGHPEKPVAHAIVTYAIPSSHRE